MPSRTPSAPPPHPQAAHRAPTPLARAEAWATRTCPVMRLVGGALPSAGCASRASQARLCIRRRPPRAARRRGPERAPRWRHVSRLDRRNLRHGETPGRLPPGHRGRAARADPGSSRGGLRRPLLPRSRALRGWGGQECAGRARRQVTRAKWPHQAVRLDARADDLDHGLHPGRVVCQSSDSSCAVRNPIKPLAVSLTRCETPPTTGSLREPRARSWALCGSLVPSSGAGTGAQCRGTLQFSWSRVTPAPRADNPGPLVRWALVPFDVDLSLRVECPAAFGGGRHSPAR